MSTHASLFSQKLKEHRIKCGRNGRMTQEELADALSVSVDAISKYERSLSFIRGDLESRLTDVLGWSREDVIACRQDWEARQSIPDRQPYRLVLNRDILGEFQDDAVLVSQAIAAMEIGGETDIPEGFAADDPVWCELQHAGCVFGSYIMHGSQLVGHAGLMFPGSQVEQTFLDRRLDESKLEPALFKRPILPGQYFAYCPEISLATGHEHAARLLLSGYVKLLEDFAAQDVIIRKLGALSINAMGWQLCEDIGLHYLGSHRTFPDFGVWTMDARNIATSLLGRRSPRLRKAYEAASRESLPSSA